MIDDRTVAVEARRAFGFFFICVALAVGTGSVITEIAYLNNAPPYWYAIIWLGSFGAVFGGAAARLREAAPAIRARIKTSVKWSIGSKVLNGICWAGPFAAIIALPSLSHYLILLGIGLGNLSTHQLLRKHGAIDNRDQLVVASISLAAIPVAFAIDSVLATDQDIALMLSRILIAIAYAAGGLSALLQGTKAGPVGFDPTTSGSLQ